MSASCTSECKAALLSVKAGCWIHIPLGFQSEDQRLCCTENYLCAEQDSIITKHPFHAFICNLNTEKPYFLGRKLDTKEEILSLNWLLYFPYDKKCRRWWMKRPAFQHRPTIGTYFFPSQKSTSGSHRWPFKYRMNPSNIRWAIQIKSWVSLQLLGKPFKLKR